MNGKPLSRRNFMVRSIIAIAAFIGAAILIPLGGFGVLPALKKRKPGWSDVGSELDLAVNEPQERRFFQVVKTGWQEQKLERYVWLVKKPDGSVMAFSPNCPHLGCGYRWFPSDRRFKCPCHASVFDVDGKVLSGPAPRPLDTLGTRVENGKLFVQYEVFQVGTSKKVEA